MDMPKTRTLELQFEFYIPNHFIYRKINIIVKYDSVNNFIILLTE